MSREILFDAWDIGHGDTYKTNSLAEGLAVNHPLQPVVRLIALRADTQVRHGEALEEVRRRHSRRGVVRQGALEVGIVKRGSEVGHGFPYRVIQKHRTAGDSTV